MTQFQWTWCTHFGSAEGRRELAGGSWRVPLAGPWKCVPWRKDAKPSTKAPLTALSSGLVVLNDFAALGGQHFRPSRRDHESPAVVDRRERWAHEPRLHGGQFGGKGRSAAVVGARNQSFAGRSGCGAGSRWSVGVQTSRCSCHSQPSISPTLHCVQTHQPLGMLQTCCLRQLE